MTGTLTYHSWMGMMARCFNPKYEHFAYYGGKGIAPCAFLKSSPVNLMFLIGQRASSDFTLDRINNELGYTCGQCEECLKNGWVLNVRWVTATEQARNRSNNIWLMFKGTKTLYVDLIRQIGPRAAERIRNSLCNRDE